jgi:beta-lactamase class A
MTTTQLAQEVTRIGDASGAVVGFGFFHPQSGQRLCLNQGQGFPMASTYKIAMAARLLSLVDDSAIQLGDMIAIDQDEVSPGSGLIRAHLQHPGLAMSVHNLINLAMTVSDNTATDKMLELAGGQEAVNEFLQTNGIQGMRIDRPTKLLLTDAFGVTDRVPGGQWSYEFLRENQESVFEKGPDDEPVNRFLIDPRDTSTPEAMVDLLSNLLGGELVSASSTKVLLDIMEQCSSGQDRLPGLLPPDTTVAHKTGTIPRACANDAGIITLPDGGHAIVAVFVKATSASDFIGASESAQVIAQIARSAYDYAVFAGS